MQSGVRGRNSYRVRDFIAVAAVLILIAAGTAALFAYGNDGKSNPDQGAALVDAAATTEVTNAVLGLNETQLNIAKGNNICDMVRVRVVNRAGVETHRSGWTCIVAFTSGLNPEFRYYVDAQESRTMVTHANRNFTAPGTKADEGFYRGLAEANPGGGKPAAYTVVSTTSAGAVVVVNVGFPR